MGAPDFFEWLLRASWQASVLVVLVMVIQWLLRKRLAPRWRYILWFLVVGRLLLPWMPESSLSLFNYARWHRADHALASISNSAHAPELLAVVPQKAEGTKYESTTAAPMVLEAASSQTAKAEAFPQLGSNGEPQRTEAVSASGNWLKKLAAGLWFAGVIALLTRILVQTIIFARKLRQGEIISDPHICELFEQCKAVIGIRVPIQLTETPVVVSPSLYGHFKPILLLPVGMSAGFTPAELRYIFLHELAHVKRRDMTIHWVVTALNVLHWFNPILWLAFRRMAADRELACDELALSQIPEQETKPYGETIIRILESCARPAASPGLLGILESKDQMVRRISMIARFKKRARWSIPALLLLLGLGAVSLTDARSQKSRNTEGVQSHSVLQTATESSTNELHFRVIDTGTEKPLAGVKVEVSDFNRTGVGPIFRPVMNRETDSDGACSIIKPDPIPGSFYFRIKISKDGYVAKYVSWSGYQKDRITDIPAEYTARMERGITIGGIVRNEEGAGIPHARLVFTGPSPSGVDDRERPTIMGDFHTEVTDEGGHWQCNHVPGYCESFIYRLQHPQYIATEFGTERPLHTVSNRVTFASLVETNAVMVLRRGLSISGTVLEQAGKPVPQVMITMNREWRNPSATITNDADGRFSIQNAKPGEVMLTFEASHFAPRTITVTASNSMPGLTVELKPGRILKGKVVDEAGVPVVGAHVAVARVNFTPSAYQWDTRTDSDGRFLWDSAPEEAAVYDISKAGYEGAGDFTFVADGSEHLVTLKRSSRELKEFTLTGKVIGELSRKPIERFTVNLKEYEHSEGFSPFHREFQNLKGEFSLKLNSEARYDVEISAEGYMPQANPGKLSAKAGEVKNLDFDLAQGSLIAGTILLPNGQPASGVAVMPGSEETSSILGDRGFQYNSQSIVTHTREDGTFFLPPSIGAHTLYAAHEAGYAELDLASAKAPLTIKLLPWGRIEGTVVVGGKPAPFQEMGLLPAFYGSPYQRRLGFAPDCFTKRADAHGNFVIEHVPPVEVRLCRMVDRTYHQAQFVQVKPGETTRVTHGVNGRLLVGKITLDPVDPSIRLQGNHWFQLRTKLPDPPFPKKPTQQEAKDWANRYWNSPEGKAYQRAQRSYGLIVRENGSFQIEDVLPGTYELDLDVRVKQSQNSFPGRSIGRLKKEVVVPESPIGPQAAPLDLGSVEIELIKTLHPGDAAPDFEVKTLAGEPLRLSSFRGKYVLLDFWATWCGPCRAQIPDLKTLYATHGRDQRFALISLSLDQTVGDPREYCRTNAMDWTQAFLGNWSDSPVPKAYGVEGIPALFLIGPDGNIVEPYLRGDQAKAVVERALLKP